jgi:uncharacterized membrane protein YeaQ/YmgE (transglycosylase-associated protein family)
MRSSEPFRRMSPIEWSCMLAFCAASPFVFVLATGYAARFHGPMLSVLGISSHTELLVGLFVLNVIGALIAAALLGVPLGWLAPRRPVFLGAIVGVVGGLVVSWLGRSVQPDGVALWALRIVEVGAFIGGCILFAVAGAMGSRRVAA